MKRADIKIGEEYSYTGPLAYGVEPSVVAHKVVFKDLNTGWGWLSTFESEIRDDGKVFWRFKGKRPVNPRIQPEFAYALNLPATRHTLDKDVDAGVLAETFELTKGHYLATYSYDGGVVEDTLTDTAGVHRTWAEQQEREAQKRADRLRRRKAAAPGQYPRDLSDAIENAVLAGHSLDHVKRDLVFMWAQVESRVKAEYRD